MILQNLTRKRFIKLLNSNRVFLEEGKNYLTSFPQLFYPLVTRQFFCDFHEKSEDFCVS